MDKKINRNSTLNRAYWCSSFCCTEKELIEAMDIMASDEVGVVGLFLATRSPSVKLSASKMRRGAYTEIRRYR
jgi:hypothetical protein